MVGDMGGLQVDLVSWILLIWPERSFLRVPTSSFGRGVILRERQAFRLTLRAKRTRRWRRGKERHTVGTPYWSHHGGRKDLADRGQCGHVFGGSRKIFDGVLTMQVQLVRM